MSLIDHHAILSAQTLSGDAAQTAQSKINAGMSLWKTELQELNDAEEHQASALFAEGFLTLPAITSSGSSLQITIGACTVLVGRYLSYAGGTATLLASQAAGVLYLCNDLTFSTSVPTTKSYMTFGTYVTTGSGVTSFTLSTGMLLPKLVTVTGTVSNINIPDDVDYVEAYLDHSAIALFEVDGKLKLTVSDTDAFTVKELYTGSVVDKDSNYANDPPHQRTDGGFWYRIDRLAAYSYAAEPNVTLTYTRTGLAIAT